MFYGTSFLGHVLLCSRCPAARFSVSSLFSFFLLQRFVLTVSLCVVSYACGLIKCVFAGKLKMLCLVFPFPSAFSALLFIPFDALHEKSHQFVFCPPICLKKCSGSRWVTPRLAVRAIQIFLLCSFSVFFVFRAQSSVLNID